MQHPFLKKPTRKLGIKGVNSTYKNPTTNIMLNEKRLNVFSVRLVTGQECLLSSLLFNILLKILASEKRQYLKFLNIKDRKEEVKLPYLWIINTYVERTVYINKSVIC